MSVNSTCIGAFGALKMPMNLKFPFHFPVGFPFDVHYWVMHWAIWSPGLSSFGKPGFDVLRLFPTARPFSLKIEAVSGKIYSVFLVIVATYCYYCYLLLFLLLLRLLQIYRSCLASRSIILESSDTSPKPIPPPKFPII